MWWVPPMPAEALRVVDMWGFRLTTMAGLTWAKRTKHGRWAFGMGHWTRANSESCLIAVRGRPKRVSASVSQLIEAPVGRHSAKPPEARDRLTALCGDAPRIELFARERAAGWDAWGLEVGQGKHDGDPTNRYAVLIEAVEAAERERCAKLCEAVHADTAECPELALYCAERVRGPNAGVTGAEPKAERPR
jgi:hypothetical protein